jgi:hypothetical protein
MQYSQQTEIHAPGGIRTGAIPASERPHTNALDRAATAICTSGYIGFYFVFFQLHRANE